MEEAFIPVLMALHDRKLYDRALTEHIAGLADFSSHGDLSNHRM